MFKQKQELTNGVFNPMTKCSFKWVDPGEKFKTPAGKFIKTEKELQDNLGGCGNAIALDDGCLCYIDPTAIIGVYRRGKKK